MCGVTIPALEFNTCRQAQRARPAANPPALQACPPATKYSISATALLAPVSLAVCAAVTLANAAWSGEQVRRQKKCLKLWLQAGQPTRKIEATWICKGGLGCAERSCIYRWQPVGVGDMGSRAVLGSMQRMNGSTTHLLLQLVQLLLGAAVGGAAGSAHVSCQLRAHRLQLGQGWALQRLCCRVVGAAQRVAVCAVPADAVCGAPPRLVHQSTPHRLALRMAPGRKRA